MDAIKKGLKLMLQFIGAAMKAAVNALEANAAKANAAQQQIQQQTRLMQQQKQQANLNQQIYQTMMNIAEELYTAIGHIHYIGAIEIQNVAALRIKDCRPEPPYWAFYYAVEKSRNFRLGEDDLKKISHLMNEDILRKHKSLIRQYGEQQAAVQFPYLYHGLQVTAVMDTGYEIMLRVITPLHMVNSQ